MLARYGFSFCSLASLLFMFFAYVYNKNYNIVVLCLVKLIVVLKKIVRVVVLLLVVFGYSQKAAVTVVNDTAQYYLNTARKHYMAGEYNLHKAYSDSLYVFSKSRGLVNMQIKAMVNRAVNLNIQGNYQNTIETYRKALALSKTLPNDIHTQVLVMVNLANTYSNVGLYEESITLMEQVLQKARLTEQPDVMRMAALNGLSKNYSAIGNEEAALQYAKQVRDLAQKLGNRSAELTAINHISNSYYKLGQFNKAIEIAQEALTFEEMKLPTKAKAWVLLSLGEAHEKLEHYTEAETYLNEALQIALDKNILEIKMLCYQKLMAVYQFQNKTEALTETERLYAETKIEVLNNQKEGANDALKAEIITKEKEQEKYEKSISALIKKNKTIITVGLFIVVVLLIILLYRRKGIGQETKANWQESVSVQPEAQKTESYKNSALSATDRAMYKQQLEQVMAQDKPYLKDTFSQAELAETLKISTHYLSEVLHYEFQQNFYALVNQYRVDYSKALLVNPEYKDAKMLAIAYESGFKSKTTFYRVFKSLVGVTPLEYKNKAVI